MGVDSNGVADLPPLLDDIGPRRSRRPLRAVERLLGSGDIRPVDASFGHALGIQTISGFKI